MAHLCTCNIYGSRCMLINLPSLPLQFQWILRLKNNIIIDEIQTKCILSIMYNFKISIAFGYIQVQCMHVVILSSSDNVLFIILRLNFAFYFDKGTHFQCNEMIYMYPFMLYSLNCQINIIINLCRSYVISLAAYDYNILLLEYIIFCNKLL